MMEGVIMNQERIGKFIAICRKEKGFTQAQLAEKLGVTEKSIGNWENGRNMPDLSLFSPLCNILGISINDLMSGEKVDDRKYINTLEENMVNMVANIKKGKRKQIKMFIVIFLIFITFLYVGRFLYMNYELDVKYDKRFMKCNILNQELQFEIKGQSTLNTHYISRVIDDKTVYFFHSTINIFNKRRSHFEYAESLARVLDNRDIPFASSDRIAVGKQNTEVYYTNFSLRKVKKANHKELQKMMKKSYLMCTANET